MSSVRVIIHPPKERSRPILPDILHQQMTAPGVLVEEIGDVMDEPRNEDQGPLGRLSLDCEAGVNARTKQATKRGIQLSQLMTGRSLLSDGQASCS